MSGAGGAPASGGGADGPQRVWFDRPSIEVARELLGMRLVHDSARGRVGGVIVEVEAYQGPEDLAAHSARGRTARNEVMFGPPGHLYVYLIYGLHHCLNVVCGPGTKPEAVLLRAAAIDEGIALATERRGAAVSPARLASGPGNLGRAFGIDRSLNGVDLLSGPVRLTGQRQPGLEVATGTRVGVAYAGQWADQPLRYWIAHDPHVSRR